MSVPPRSWKRAAAGAAVLIAAGSAGAAAQSTAPPPPSDVTFSIGYEAHRDRFRYEFENPSNFDTPFLVPHSFAQTYVADNQWLVGSVRYPLLGDMMETEFGITPDRGTTASDLDTFYDPTGDVIVSGTDGAVSMHALRFAEWSEAKLWGLSLRLGYVFRRDVTVFHSTERLVSHTSPPSFSRTPIQTHETTYSHVHEVPLGVMRQDELGPRWTLTTRVDVSPLTVAMLTTILPEKYPGQEIAFIAKVAAVSARAQLAWNRGRWPLLVTAAYGRTFSYRSASQFHRDALELGVRVGLAR